MSSTDSQPEGPPYLPRGAQPGGTPTVPIDVPISAVFLALFVAGAAANMTILQVNRRRGHKFLISGACFGFCMALITANAMRIAWAAHPDNASLAIAASIFANAGVLILYVVNLIFLQRVVRAHHPRFGWSKAVGWVFKALYFAIAAALIMVITAVVYSFYTLDREALNSIRTVRLVAVVFLAVLSFLPFPGTLLAVLVPSRDDQAIDGFGHGAMRTKVILLLFTSTLLSLGACLRAGTSFLPMRTAGDPGWYNHRAVFYCFSYVLELIVLYTYTIIRIDRRFHIPNGSSAPGHYSNGVPEAEQGASSDASSLVEKA